MAFGHFRHSVYIYECRKTQYFYNISHLTHCRSRSYRPLTEQCFVKVFTKRKVSRRTLTSQQTHVLFGRVPTPRAGDLIENIRCHQTDEYPVVNAEDETPVPPLACNFSRATNTNHILALVDENGSVILYNTNKAGDDAIITDWSAHNNAIFDVKWMQQENKILTASGDQTVCLWDVKTNSEICTFKGHTSSVRSVGFRPFDDAVFSSGSRDGHIRLWDVRCNIKENVASSVNVIRNAHTITNTNTVRKKKSRLGQNIQDSQQSVTCVVFQDDNLLATGGAVDGCVKVWDMRKVKSDNPTPVYSFPYSGTSKRTHGYSSLVFDSYFSRLYANCTDDVIYCYDFTTYNAQPVCVYKGHRNTSFYVKSCLSPDNQFLLSGSSDEHACIWQSKLLLYGNGLKYVKSCLSPDNQFLLSGSSDEHAWQVDQPSSSPVILKGHRSEISDVAWCKADLFRLVTTSDDYTMRVWRLDPTAKIRKQKGHTDQMYNITGTAECTHRDIGISTPQTPTVSPKSSLKRAATVPVNIPLQLTPKRPKIPVAATPSPSIKAWLKRSASDTQVSPSCDSANKKSKVTDNVSVMRKSVKRSASEMESDDTNVMDAGNVEKRPKMDNIGENTQSTDNSEVLGENNCALRSHSKPVCKRALIPSSSDSCRNKINDTKINEYPNKENESETTDKKTGSSPNKRILKETNINSSPEKAKEIENVQDFYSPIRSRLFDRNSSQIIQSPTANLPNSVFDEPISSPRQTVDCKTKKKVDWLTEMRIQKLSGVNKSASPSNKQCSRRLLDKLNSSEKVETTPDKVNQDAETPIKSKPVSPVRGTKSITSFFRRQQNV